MTEQGVDSAQLLRQPLQLRWGHRLVQRPLIAYGTKHDGLDPF